EKYDIRRADRQPFLRPAQDFQLKSFHVDLHQTHFLEAEFDGDRGKRTDRNSNPFPAIMRSPWIQRRHPRVTPGEYQVEVARFRSEGIILKPHALERIPLQ